MKELKIKALLFTDGEHYLIHGSDSEDPATMFKQMLPLWNLDPEKECIRVVDFTLFVPDIARVFVAGTSLGPQDFEPEKSGHPSTWHHDDMPITLAKDDPHVEDNRMELTLDDLKLS